MRAENLHEWFFTVFWGDFENHRFLGPAPNLHDTEHLQYFKLHSDSSAVAGAEDLCSGTGTGDPVSHLKHRIHFQKPHSEM